MKILHLLVLVVGANALYIYNKQGLSCGYSNCPPTVTNPNILNIHLVAHSHDDVGWLKTFDQYYYGSKNYIHKAGVQYILDSVIEALLLNPERRFIYVETSFFWKWWQEKGEKTRKDVKELINNGQLEIIGGAWSMNDEAATHYQSIIDQFTLGFRKLEETLGKCARPKIGWQIDPFGHSKEQASLFSQLGFDGFFFTRLDYRDRRQRQKTGTSELIWQGSDTLGPSSRIFTSILYENYMTPPGFCFDIMCPDSPIVDNKQSPEYNAETRAKMFLEYARKVASVYRTNNIIITMGGDFHYQEALSYFGNMDRLIKAITTIDPKVHIFYSTPSCYLQAVNQANLTWTVKNDDFFPYASDAHSYWSGYFTSRPTSKRFERFANNILQATKQLTTLAFPKHYEEKLPQLEPLQEAIGVMQHHDAITGTEKQHVANDYARMLHEAVTISTKLASDSLRHLTKQSSEVKFESCLLLNISQCEHSESSNNFFITVYNPRSKPIDHYVRIPVAKKGYKVFDSSGNAVEAQYVPIFSMILSMPGRNSTAEEELVFQAVSVPPLGYKIYNIRYFPDSKHNESNKPFNNKHKIKLFFNTNAELEYMSVNNTNIVLRQSFYYYTAATGNNMIPEKRSSGAYIFRPKTQQAIKASRYTVMKTVSGPHVMEYHQIINDWIGCVVRLYADKNYVEFNWFVGPIPVDNYEGREVISRFSTDIESSGVFYTDSNGREMIKRIRDHRETFSLTHEEPVAQNYYPVTSRITLHDEKRGLEFSVLNDRSQGGSSLKDGEVELMLHRRLLHDDAFGVEEALNERAFGTGLVAVGKHYVTAKPTNNVQGTITRDEELSVLLEPLLFITPADNSKINFNKSTSYNLDLSTLRYNLPNNVHILTLEPWSNNRILLRLEHIADKNHDFYHQLPAKLDIKNLFTTFNVEHVEEVSLGANMLVTEVTRMKWKAEDGVEDNTVQKKRNLNFSPSEIVLHPMEIKTFIVTIQ